MQYPLPWLPPQIKVEEAPPLRLAVWQSLKSFKKGVGFCGMVSCDVERYDQFLKRCRAEHCRPPSMYAYASRCLGLALQNNRELLAILDGSKLFMPSRVDILLAIERTSAEGIKAPAHMLIQGVDARPLVDIAEDIKVRSRQAKRTPLGANAPSPRFAPKWAPAWWRNGVKYLQSRRPARRQHELFGRTAIKLSSTTQWMEGCNVWGVQVFTMNSISITLTGMARRPVVVGDGLEPHMMLDIVVHFDHRVVDGAPVTRFIRAFLEELESGRALEEYPLIGRDKKRSKTAEDLD